MGFATACESVRCVGWAEDIGHREEMEDSFVFVPKPLWTTKKAINQYCLRIRLIVLEMIPTQVFLRCMMVTAEPRRLTSSARNCMKTYISTFYCNCTILSSYNAGFRLSEARAVRCRRPTQRVFPHRSGYVHIISKIWWILMDLYIDWRYKRGIVSSGCTSCVCLLQNIDGERKLHTAHLGDARAVIARAGVGIRLTSQSDHKATDPKVCDYFFVT